MIFLFHPLLRAVSFNLPLRLDNRDTFMRAILLSSLFLATVFLFVCEAAAQEEVPTPVKASLISDVDAIVPGKPFKAGVLLEIIPRWHIYWKHSGDAGLPTKVSFKLPVGFTTGELKWPVPEVFKGAGGVADYGYENSVLLYSLVNVPEGLKTGSEKVISADVSWVSCEEICIPERALLDLKLPVSDKQQQVNTELFSRLESAFPLMSSDEGSPFGVEIGGTEKIGASGVINIVLSYKKPVSNIGLYPVPGNGLSVTDITVNNSHEEGKTDIKLEVHALSGRELEGSNLETLLVYTDKDGKRSGVRLDIPIGN